MKANFALILDQDGIVLLNRTKAGWRVVGQADPASERLAAEMSYLRATAMELSGGRFTTKLIIPNSQILYTAFSIDAAQQQEIRNAIRDSLEGMTPYAGDELAFDWAETDDGRIAVSAVADLTLSEAESFAEEHRFNPLCFAAIPEPGDFPREPFFGASAKSRQLLNPGGAVEQDKEPIDILAVLAAMEKDAAAASASDTAVSVGAEAPVPLVERAPEEETAVTQAVIQELHADVVPAEDLSDEAQDTFSEEEQIDSAAMAAPDGDAEPAAETVSPLSAEPTAQPENQSEGDDLPPAQVSPKEDGSESVESQENDEGDSEAEAEVAVAFTSSRSGKAPQKKGRELAGIAARFSPRPEPVSNEPHADENTHAPEVSVEPVDPPKVEPESEPEQPAVVIVDEPAKTGETVAAKITALRSEAPKAADNVPVFATPPRPVTPGAGRLGRAGLLVGLGMIAALGLAVATAYMMLGDPDNPIDGSGLVQSVPESLPTPAAATDLQAALDVPLAQGDQMSAARNPASISEPIASLDPLADTDLSPDTRALYGIDAPEITLSGIRQLAPVSPIVPASERIDDLYTPALDAQVISHDAVAIQVLTLFGLDAGIGLQVPPPEFGTDFAFGDDGLVIATAEGTLSPDGILIFAGAPAIRALPRPFADVVIAPDGLGEERRQVLAAILPTPRPGTIAEDSERAQLSGLSRNELGGFRPLPRPAALEALAIALANQPEPDSSPTDLAVTASLKPVARPQGLAQITRAAAVEAVRPPPPPRGATVAQAATIQNALRLNNVNLIGVYGTSSSRRALVRLSGGRFVMVTPGDRMNGGVVQAISTDSLVYRKGGRNITLEVPNG